MIKRLIASPINRLITSPIGGVKPIPKRWLTSANGFVIADTNGRIIIAGK